MTIGFLNARSIFKGQKKTTQKQYITYLKSEKWAWISSVFKKYPPTTHKNIWLQNNIKKMWQNVR